MAELNDGYGAGLVADITAERAAAGSRRMPATFLDPTRSPGQWALQTPWYVFLRWAGTVVAPKGEHAACCALLSEQTLIELARFCEGGAAPAMLPLPGSVIAGRRFIGGNPALPENWPYMA
ncbi:hypothetical protein SAMN02745911_0407 [Aureimonas altamirensis DSM 21988]|uniref:Uncharacterized protein n=1 Tax=Aureimonas altamirensis DSM 21988 TaxID=1121026 RepID=A0ABY1I2V4_9HYPH|nr:hypothetical protein [Aureimonas altamirensis]SHI52074.1 hypothetical protein SAMN02745911_0407 [Aureimonas altamirensis DSM 21988]